mmetsp:Transcript_23831/g.42001  ORF Transcript_23831/g.42001 Transcript_23831/m.42001 type:complete len:276 (-) Transcript_23831:354-1181(-)|eukprot:CAMPEP_0184559268 /NCGR_PEP_ID=MMETSP0199_2-20130426/46338_1 /TAXON_ID=1112570 /ORGANISM="Thraustochytrium sp., Strain LLF1b" /LENGTH=275 /DNA_ID=CAMNT_0026956555 /DNA_START=481 /DNA_END=1308 /DNA_ORIENTATION=+
MDRTVTFQEQVDVYILPYNEKHDAWLARHGPWLCAPFHDELWDGNLKAFRPTELTKAELRRVIMDEKVKRILPSSVFYLYRKSRQRLAKSQKNNRSNKRLSLRKSLASKRKSSKATVPPEYIGNLGKEGRPAEDPALQNESTASDLNRSDSDYSSVTTSSEEPEERRWSLSNEIRKSLRRRSTALDWLAPGQRTEEETDDENLREDALPWLELLQRLDGLDRTTVARSNSVETLWDQLSDNWSNLHLLGQTIIWDGQAILREIWPGNPLDPTRGY